MNPPSHSCSSVPSAAKKNSVPPGSIFWAFLRFLWPFPQRFRSVALSLALALLATAPAHATEEFFDRLSTALSTHSLDGFFRARVSGLLDAEAYHLPKPAPALLETTRTDFFQPRLTLFLDAQFGRSVYLFAQARGDTGFDPADGPARQRLDEYALRLTPWRDARASLQVGKFATIVGNWVARHGTWENPFINAPLPYEHLTGMWDTEAVRSTNQLLLWSHLRPSTVAANLDLDKQLRLPLVWGPAYATGLAVSGKLGRFLWSTEVKHAPLSSRPASWTKAQKWWTYPAVAARLAWSPNPMWQLGLSASTGTYLRPSARPTLATGTGRGDYRQETLAADIAFAWHHWQIWSEVYRVRFVIPRIGDADTLAAYVEAKYKITPRLSAAVRVNRQTFGSLTDGPRGLVRWGGDVWRTEFAPAFRVTPHIQLKLQTGWQHEAGITPARTATHAAQLTVRF